MRHYSPRDLRAADMLALILVGFGIALVVLGVLANDLRPLICGVASVCLGTALTLKVRQERQGPRGGPSV